MRRVPTAAVAAGSHPPARKVGAWPAVLAVSAAAAAVAWALADRDGAHERAG